MDGSLWRLSRVEQKVVFSRQGKIVRKKSLCVSALSSSEWLKKCLAVEQHREPHIQPAVGWRVLALRFTVLLYCAVVPPYARLQYVCGQGCHQTWGCKSPFCLTVEPYGEPQGGQTTANCSSIGGGGGSVGSSRDSRLGRRLLLRQLGPNLRGELVEVSVDTTHAEPRGVEETAVRSDASRDATQTAPGTQNQKLLPVRTERVLGHKALFQQHNGSGVGWFLAIVGERGRQTTQLTCEGLLVRCYLLHDGLNRGGLDINSE